MQEMNRSFVDATARLAEKYGTVDRYLAELPHRHRNRETETSDETIDAMTVDDRGAITSTRAY
ncbi:hypothetical protein [Rhodococcus tibetensis]|uniref:Transposase n=1 Tax=Rhodococcus tibetensis TaxID=2965064 RepID=A0ABT1QJY5_9NOCA|nr:hypothetical protein [Rhodococcus sp. FXJ9.536]MCQ4122561.1 hypothetical protein [Rhodococcus sp. FXJ9.536]